MNPDNYIQRALADEHDVARRVVFHGAVEPGRRFEWIHQVDICLLPLTETSIGGRYTSPLKLFEYMAAGKAIIVSDLPSMRQVLTSERDALLVPVGDPQAFARAIERMLQDTALCACLRVWWLELGQRHFPGTSAPKPFCFLSPLTVLFRREILLMNELEKYFFSNTGNLIHKWRHYFEIYDRHFSRYRGSDVHVLEIGAYQGGSLQMWKHYFGPSAQIYGVDINPECKKLEEPQIQILIGDQEDRKFLRSVVESVPRIDILIDDGGHTMKQQINTFEILFPHIDKNGIYLCEDLHTSYLREFGGRYKNDETFIEYSKNFIDYIHGWRSEQPRKLAVSEFTRSVYALHYYESVLVIEKRPIEKPHDLTTGSHCISKYRPKRSFLYRLFGPIRRK